MSKNEDRFDQYYKDIKSDLEKIQKAIKPIAKLLLEINGEVAKLRRENGTANNASQ